jgi:hypothetical protein
MPKGEKIKVKAINGSATTWEILKIVIYSFWFVKTLLLSLLSKLASCGEKCWLWEKGGVFESLVNFLWNTSFYVSTSEFDLEIGNRVWFAKTNQVVAKNDPYMPNLIQNKFEFLFELILYLFYLPYVMLALITKKGEIEGWFGGKGSQGDPWGEIPLQFNFE